MLAFLQAKALTIVLSMIPIGAIAFTIMQIIKRQAAWVDNLTPTLKRGAVFLIAAVLTALGAWAKVPIICEEGVNCLTTLDQSTIEALLKAGLGALTALLAFFAQQKKK